MVSEKGDTQNLKSSLALFRRESLDHIAYIFCLSEVNILLNKRCYPSLIMLVTLSNKWIASKWLSVNPYGVDL